MCSECVCVFVCVSASYLRMGLCIEVRDAVAVVLDMHCSVAGDGWDEPIPVMPSSRRQLG